MTVLRSKTFDRSFRKFTKNRPNLKETILETLAFLEHGEHLEVIRDHKLTGELKGLKSCSCGYDCRIIYEIVDYGGGKAILLLDVGKHSEVY